MKLENEVITIHDKEYIATYESVDNGQMRGKLYALTQGKKVVWKHKRVK